MPTNTPGMRAKHKGVIDAAKGARMSPMAYARQNRDSEGGKAYMSDARKMGPRSRK